MGGTREEGSNELIRACPTLHAAEIHRQIGHISQKSMKQLLDQQMISGLEVSRSDNTFTCDACIQAKIAQVPLPKESREHAKKMGDRIHGNTCVPSKVLNLRTPC